MSYPTSRLSELWQYLTDGISKFDKSTFERSIIKAEQEGTILTALHKD